MKGRPILKYKIDFNKGQINGYFGSIDVEYTKSCYISLKLKCRPFTENITKSYRKEINLFNRYLRLFILDTINKDLFNDMFLTDIDLPETLVYKSKTHCNIEITLFAKNEISIANNSHKNYLEYFSNEICNHITTNNYFEIL